jgi:N-acetylneuraminic acid mutarotase
MPRSSPFQLTLAFGALALAACGDQTSPTQPESSEPPHLTTAAAAAASNTWTEKAAFPGGEIGVSLAMAPNAAGQSIAYAIGGSIEGELPSSTIRAYNVTTNTWAGTGGTHFGATRSDMNGIGKVGSKLYFSGGYVELSDIDEASPSLFAYDYRSNRLIKRADMPKATAEGVTGVIDGKLYVLPGVCSTFNWPLDPRYCETEPTRQLYRYDPATNTWDSRRPAPNYHRGAGGAVLDGKFYVVGGGTAALDVYDPRQNTWRTLAPIPTGGSATATAIQGRLFVVTNGMSRDPSLIRTYSYNPVTNTWKALAAPPGAMAITLVKLDGKPRVLAIRGTGEEGHVLPSHLYTP